MRDDLAFLIVTVAPMAPPMSPIAAPRMASLRPSRRLQAGTTITIARRTPTFAATVRTS